MIFLLLLMQLNFLPSEPNLEIIKSPKTNHLYHFSNKTGTFWVGETAQQSDHFLMGLISYREQILNDYILELDGHLLDRKQSLKQIYQPWLFSRSYPKGINEHVFMPDGYDGMVIQLNSTKGSYTKLILQLSNPKEIIESIKDSNPNRVIIQMDQKLNSYLVLASNQSLSEIQLKKNKLHITFKTDEDPANQLFSIGLGSNQAKAQQQAILMLSNYDVLVSSKRERIVSLLNSIGFESSNVQLNKAVNFAIASFDALNMNETRTNIGKGIYAGYPWFQDFWGRDSFIALRALTITSQFELAKENLMSFLNFQESNPDNNNYGKIPNRVRPNEILFNTADATPRFIIEAKKYIDYSNDQQFKSIVLPKINHAILGSLKYRVDSLGFLVHDDADTWMDAKGPKGAYSPRGNRANDIQYLWIEALKAAVKLSEDSKKYQELYQTSNETLAKVKANFADYFYAKTDDYPALIDAVAKDGELSKQTRVNQIFTLDILSKDRKAKVVKDVLTRLGTPYGPMSLSPKDEWFHPYHKVEPLYEQDASYHNGIIWVWNSGDFVKALFRYGQESLAFDLIENYSRRMFEDVPLGTLPELYDAYPRSTSWSQELPTSEHFKNISRIDQMALNNTSSVNSKKEPAASGTFSQAWSLSEFIRMNVEHMPGIRKQDSIWVIEPYLPNELEFYRFSTTFSAIKVDVAVMKNKIELQIKNYNKPASVVIRSKNFAQKVIEFRIPVGDYTINYSSDKVEFVNKDGKSISNFYERPTFFQDQDEVIQQLGKLSWPEFSPSSIDTSAFKTHLE